VKVLFDTNVILDVLLDRQPFSDDAAQLMSRVECSEIQWFIFTLRNFAYSAMKGLQVLSCTIHESP